MPKYRPLSDEEQEAIQQAARRLSELKGYVDTPRLRKAISKWVEELPNSKENPLQLRRGFALYLLL